MKIMKVYVLNEFVYSVDDGICSNILGTYKNKKDAEKKRDLIIQDNIKNYGFVTDEEKHETTIIFLEHQENWDNYIEYEIIESEVL